MSDFSSKYPFLDLILTRRKPESSRQFWYTCGMSVVASIHQLSKIYRKPGTNVEVAALRNVDLDFIQGEYTAIMGASGSGKSTMMNIIGCLDRPTSGSYVLGSDDVSQMDDDSLSEIRSS